MRVCSNFASSGETFGDAAGTTDGLANPASTAAVDDAGGAGRAQREAGAGSRRRAVWFPTDLCALLLAAKFNQTKVR